MRQIQVTDEMYDFLMNLSEELNAQDHRFTAMPYLFQIQSEERVVAAEGCGEMAWHKDGELLDTDEDIEDAVNEYKDKNSVEYSLLENWEIEDILENNGWEKVYYEYNHVYKNGFLTAKACKEHIEANDYHYCEPKCYLTGAFRNPELEQLMKFLCELSGGKIHK